MIGRLPSRATAGAQFGFFNGIDWVLHPYVVWPTAQPAAAAQAAVVIVNANGVIAALTISVGYSQAEVTALRDACEVLADDVRNLAALVDAQRTVMVAAGIMKGGA